MNGPTRSAATIAPMILEYLRARYLRETHAHAEGLGRSPMAAYGIGLVHGIGGQAPGRRPVRSHVARLGQLAPVTGQLNPAITQLLTGIQPLVDQGKAHPILSVGVLENGRIVRDPSGSKQWGSRLPAHVRLTQHVAPLVPSWFDCRKAMPRRDAAARYVEARCPSDRLQWWPIPVADHSSTHAPGSRPKSTRLDYAQPTATPAQPKRSPATMKIS